ncbi:MAG TPA: hypothetical protein VJ901_14755 [Thermoanaerobaculia bacterium]|nr:hypothetical protein [Thermoanaerobaculia bacterium]
MRKLVIVLVVLIAIAGAIGAFLFFTTPSQSRGVKFPIGAADRALLAQVPEDADAFVLIPSAAALRVKLEANPLTSDLLTRAPNVPRAWMLGGADVVAWSANKKTTYLVHLDPLRAFVARMFSANNGALLINARSEHPIDGSELDRIITIANGLPPGDALAVQRASGRGAFPPIPRPAVSSIAVSADEIAITSRAPADPDDVIRPTPIRVRFPKTAILTASFTKPPRALELNRIFARQITTLLADGGMIAIYDVDTGTLIPKPREVIAIPATPERREALASVVRMIGSAGQELTGLRTVDSGNELVVSFDQKSLDHYLKDGADDARWPANVWSAKVDPGRMVPLLNEIDGNPALKIVAPKLHRSVRDLKHWIGSMEKAKSIEAAGSSDGVAEDLKVVIR